ncbi:hypothetical protein K7432_018549 [Basidiobolus ranarum]|uniref:Cytochrome P450 n=1 Tax=Basidiobolus ranarum TaxID=34480 RepID=A0ABR2VIW0_9FUNG
MIALIITFLSLLLLFPVYYYLSIPDGLRTFPTIPIRSLLHSLGKPKTLVDAYKPMRGILERFGIAKVWILGEWYVIISRAEHAKTIYSKPGNLFDIAWRMSFDLRPRKSQPNIVKVY